MNTSATTPPSDFLPMWVVYKNPSDFPGKFVVRRQLAAPGFVVADKAPTAIVSTLDEARAAIPPGMINLHRSPDDDPCIAEVWL